MAITTKKNTDEELKAPSVPGAVNNSAVQTASAGVSAAKSALEGMNYDTFKQGSAYKGLQKSYQDQGRIAMQDTLGQVAARTGGMASSYATTAANQSYNNYMKTLEDAARSMYNDEYLRAQDKYNMAQQEYENAYGEYRDRVGDAWNRYDAERSAFESDRGYNYQLGRDEIKDDRYNAEWQYKTGQEAKEADEKRIYTDIYYGGESDYDAYKRDGGTLSEAEYNSIVRSAQGARGDDTYDRDQAAQEQAQADVIAIWRNGGTPTPDQLEAAGWYNDAMVASEDIDMTIDNNGDGYPDNLSELGRAYYNQTEIDNYRYPNTAEGAANILNALTGSASMTLSDKDIKNFDHIYGDGAYNAVRDFIDTIGTRQTGGKSVDSIDAQTRYEIDDAIEKLISIIPDINKDQIYAIMQSANPEVFSAYGD